MKCNRWSWSESNSIRHVWHVQLSPISATLTFSSAGVSGGMTPATSCEAGISRGSDRRRQDWKKSDGRSKNEREEIISGTDASRFAIASVNRHRFRKLNSSLVAEVMYKLTVGLSAHYVSSLAHLMNGKQARITLFPSLHLSPSLAHHRNLVREVQEE